MLRAPAASRKRPFSPPVVLGGFLQILLGCADEPTGTPMVAAQHRDTCTFEGEACSPSVAVPPSGTSEGATIEGDAIIHGTPGGVANVYAESSVTSTPVFALLEGKRIHASGPSVNGFQRISFRKVVGFVESRFLTVAPPLVALRKALDDLASELAGGRSPGTEVAVAVYDFDTGEYQGLNDDVTHVSASAAKAIWVAAALDATSVAAVTNYAEPIFVDSSNEASGAVIDLVGSNAMNDFYAKAGLTRSAFTNWPFGNVPTATNSPRLMGPDNYFTAHDCVYFLERLATGTLLEPEKGAALMSWMMTSPRTGSGGWLGSLLPESARTTMLHKAGWLPPPYEERAINELGIVTLPKGDSYAIAILARNGHDYWGEHTRFVEHASCTIYRALSTTVDLDCP